MKPDSTDPRTPPNWSNRTFVKHLETAPHVCIRTRSMLVVVYMWLTTKDDTPFKLSTAVPATDEWPRRFKPATRSGFSAPPPPQLAAEAVDVMHWLGAIRP